jgi:hypothetical protein
MTLDKVRIAKGNLNSYGELEDISECTGDNEEFSIESYHNSDGKIVVIFARQGAWDAVIAKIKQDGLGYQSFKDLEKEYKRFYNMPCHSKMTNLHFEWYLIEFFLNYIRRSFITNNEFSGSQTEAFDELLFANSLIEKPVDNSE